MILEGRVRITRELQGMGEEALAIVGPGDVFGEMALLDDWVRSADARVHERCRLLAIHRDAFEELLFVHKDLAYEVLWNVVRMLTRRLRETNDKFAMLTFAAKLRPGLCRSLLEDLRGDEAGDDDADEALASDDAGADRHDAERSANALLRRSMASATHAPKNMEMQFQNGSVNARPRPIAEGIHSFFLGNARSTRTSTMPVMPPITMSHRAGPESSRTPPASTLATADQDSAPGAGKRVPSTVQSGTSSRSAGTTNALPAMTPKN